MFKEGDWVLITFKDKKFLKKIDHTGNINVGKSVLRFSDVIGKLPGAEVNGFRVFHPSLEDIILLGFRRKTQIVYPKDAFYISFKLGVGPGKKVLEFGTGSGAMCAILSYLGAEVYSFESVEKFFKTAVNNLERFGLLGKTVLNNAPFEEAELENSFFDCAFVDVKDPRPTVEKLHRVLKTGAPTCFLLPTTNQVSELLRTAEPLFGSFEVVEILHRKYKTNPDRLRPDDIMIGHTAFLIFCRKLYI